AAGIHLRNSQSAVRAGDLTHARSEALAAKAIEPWAASPYLQLGLVAETEGSFATASHWLDEAIRRSRQDWTVWITAAGIETQRGKVAAARRDLDEARRLNPNFRLFQPGG